jgi:hypothetical protein
VGCDKNPTEPATPETGAIEITVSTSSADIDVDPDGYLVSIDGAPGPPIGLNATMTIGSMPTGSHLTQLYGVASNCSVSPGNPRFVDVVEDKAASVSFLVTCTPKDDGGYWDY